MSNRSRYQSTRRFAILVSGIALLTATAALAQTEQRYGYVRVIAGGGTVFASASQSQSEIESNQPLLTGDRLWIDHGARADLVLSDGSQLSLDSSTELTFEKLAWSPDSEDQVTQIGMVNGRVVIRLGEYWTGGDAPIVDTPNARIYLQSRGSYLIETHRGTISRVVVRGGYAEVVDQRGSSLVRDGEALEVEGDDWPRSHVEPAESESAFERWSYRQDEVFARASDSELDQPLEGTVQLADHGEWVDVEGGRAWRPRVRSTWRPYWQGRWVDTPTGLYWLSSDPWYHVTYRYGSWDYDTSWGWLWRPGYSYAPAHVYWYWGPSYVGWIPSGYYNRYYGSRYGLGFGFGHGVFGYAGGSFGSFGYWNFCPVRYFGYRRSHRYYQYGRDLRGRGNLERGIITTDTTGLDRNNWDRPDEVRQTLERRYRNGRAERGAADLPDVTEFVRRADRLPETVERAVRDVPARPIATRTVSASDTPGTRAAPTRPATAPRPTTAARPSPRTATASDPARRAPGRRVLDGIRGRGTPARRPTTAQAPSPRTGGATAQRPATASRPRSTPARQPTTAPSSRPARATPSRPSRSASPPRASSTPPRRSSGGTASRPAARPAPRRSSPPRSTAPPRSGRDRGQTATRPPARSQAPSARTSRASAPRSSGRATAKPPSRGSASRKSTAGRSATRSPARSTASRASRPSSSSRPPSRASSSGSSRSSTKSTSRPPSSRRPPS